MSQRWKKIKDKIVRVTVSCIEEKGIDDVTVRDITSKAGVNTAAINYYFGSKATLLEEALRRSLDSAFLDFRKEVRADAGIALYSELVKYLEKLLSGTLKYPNTVKAHLYDPLINNNYKGVAVRRLSSLLSGLQAKLKVLVPGVERPKLKNAVVEILSAVIFPGLMPSLFTDFLGKNLNEPKIQRRYVDNLLRRYIDIKTLVK